jgi:hypothetical protein
MDEPRNGDLKLIEQDIKRARKWALKHFPTEGPDTLLDGPKFLVAFKDDHMYVQPKLYGQPLGISIRYRLVWVGDKVYWQGRNLITGREIKLEVEED